jgi:hypothetical protein
MIADFKLQAPGEYDGILAMEEFADRTKSIHWDDEAKLITIEFHSKEEYEHAYKVWDWVNDKEDNTFTLVTKADQCGDPDVRDPYHVTDIKFDPEILVVKLAASPQTWADAVHDCELNTRTIRYNKKYSRKARRQEDTIQTSGTAPSRNLRTNRVFVTQMTTSSAPMAILTGSFRTKMTFLTTTSSRLRFPQPLMS